MSCGSDDHCRTHDTRLPAFDGGQADGGQPDGGRPSLCSLPPKAGPCDAYFPRYFFDPKSERCSLFIYGGCDGNDNNFETAEACARACNASSLPLAACEVGGVLYPSGSTGIEDPLSCNTCVCIDGQVTGCTKISCPKDCPTSTKFGMDCARCGPVDNCEVVRTGCLPSCNGDEDCDAGSCIDKVCLSRCG